MPPLTKTQREQREAEESVLRERNRGAILPPRKTVSGGCKLHPEFVVDVTAGQIPPAHAGLCPYCEEIARRHPEPEKPRVIDPGSAGDKLDLAYELHRQRHGPQGIEPKSYAEEDALRRIDVLRVEEEDREARRDRSYGTLVSARIEGGRWVEYRRPPGSRHVSKVVF